MFRPYLLATFRELSLVYVAYVSTYMSEISHAIKIMVLKYFFFLVALRPNAGHGFLILDVSRSHITTHHSR